MISFALLGHPASYEHLNDLLHQLHPDLAAENPSAEALSQLFELVPSYAEKSPFFLPQRKGIVTSGRLIICTFLPERLNSPKQLSAAHQKTLYACQLAKELGAKIAGLGGFTSISIANKLNATSNEIGVALTSGSSLTSALALAQIDSIVNMANLKMEDKTVAILGASGEIGKACINALAPRVKKIILIARNKAKLDEIASSTANAFTSVDAADASQADIIVAATSSAQPILREADLKSGSIVCDIGYPKTMVYNQSPRPDVLIFSGGLAETPFNIDLNLDTGLPSANLLYGCFTETIVLAMANRFENFSNGETPITVEKMDDIFSTASSFGFKPAPLYRGNLLITADMVESVLHKNKLN